MKCKECKHYQFEANSQFHCIYSKCKYYPSNYDFFELKQWEPKLHITGYRFVTDYLDEFTRETQEQHADLEKKLISLATLDAWATEKGYKKPFKRGDQNFAVRFNEKHYMWTVCWWSDEKSYYEVYMTKKGAEATAKALNSGELVI